MCIVTPYRAPQNYRYKITFECGAEVIAPAPEVVGSPAPCGHADDHTTSTVISSTPEKNQ